MFTPATTPQCHHTERIAIIARPTARTQRMPGHAENIFVTTLTENGKRFQFSLQSAGGFYAYGRGVTVRVWQRGDTHYLDSVSMTGPVTIRAAYTLNK